MLKNTGLATKIGFGFAVIIVITAVVGGTSWFGLRSVDAQIGLNTQAAQTLEALNKCATLRRDFAAMGFQKVGDETKNAAEKWQDAYVALTASLGVLKDSSALDATGQGFVDAALSGAAEYKTTFESISKARERKDAALDGWRLTGGRITEAIVKATDEQIKPGLAQAETTGVITELSKWSAISERVSNDVVQPFLLQRISAVYVLAKNGDTEWQAYQEQLKKTKAGLASWKDLTKDNANLQAVADTVAQALKDYESAGEEYYAGLLAERAADAAMASAATKVVDTIHELQLSIQESVNAVVTRTNFLALGLTGGSILIGVLLSIIITRSITGPLKRAIDGLTAGAEQTASASGQVAQSSQSMAEGASEQASSLEETSASLEEMTSMTKQNAENANQASNLMARAKETVGDMARATDEMSQAISEIKASSGETAKIIKTIDEIAFQTNLLALNAAVEAARAGDAGKGFAVVAEEVRNLAQRSAEAAKNTAAMIENSVKNAENGVQVTQRVSEALKQTVSNSEKVAQMVAEIAAASSEQAQGIGQINTAVTQMDQVTQSNAASSEETASASEELSAQAEEMQRIVKELVAIVGGSRAVATSGHTVAHSPGTGARRLPPPAAAGTHAKRPPERRAKALTAPSAGPVKAVAPQQVIPLDDKDLEGF